MADIVSLIFKYGMASRVLDRDEARECLKLAEIIKQFLRDKADDFMARYADQPVLFSYSSDGTPMTTSTVYTHKLNKHRTVKREGGALHEFLVQRGFLKVKLAAGASACALASEPLPLDDGKPAWHLYSAAVQFYPLLREKGHKGIAIAHYAFDRALFDALEKKMRLRHEAHYQGQGANTSEAQIHWLTDWVLATGCGNHDVQNALKWGTKDLMEDPVALLKDMYVVMESVRNGYSLLHDNLRVWLLRVVTFAESGPDKDPVAEFWRALGVDADMVGELCEVNPRWAHGSLVVDKAVANDPGLMDKLTGIILYLFRFRKFTESRWTTLGEASRNMLGAMSVGLEAFVGYLRAQPSISDWHLRGFARLTSEVKRFVGVVSVDSFVPDSVLCALLEDDRVAGRLSELRALMREEYRWLCCLSTPFWNRLSSVTGGAPAGLRADALRAAVVASAYTTKKLFRVAEAFPWCLAEGDIGSNLDKVAAAEDAAEPVTRKIQILMRMGYNRHALVSAIELFKEVHWNLTGVEQGHGSAATVHRLHSMYGAEQLAARSFVHMVRPMVSKDPEEARAAKVTAQMATLAKKALQKVTGRHIFLRDLFIEAKSGLAEGEVLSQAARQGLVAKHAEMYSRLSPAARSVYSRAAERHAANAADSIGEEVVRLETQLAMQKAVVDAERARQGVLMRLSHCKFSPEDILVMSDMWEKNEFRGQALAARRQAALTAPCVPGELEQLRLTGCADRLGVQRPLAPMPLWARTVCWNRDIFQNCGITFVTGNSSQHFLFVYASQQPELVALAPLVELAAFHPYLGDKPFQQVLLAGKFAAEKKFRLNFGDFVFDKEVHLAEGTKLFVLPYFVLGRGGAVCSDAQLVPFEEFTKGFNLRPATTSAPSSSSQGPSAAAALLQEFPWLEGHFASKSGAASGKSSTTTGATREPKDDRAPALDDEAAEAAFKSLEEKRREWAALPAAGVTDFYTRIRGGSWTAANKKVGADCVGAYAKGKEVEQWCKMHNTFQSASFAFATYGERAANILGREWCRRMQNWYDLGTSSGASSSSDRPALVGPDNEPEEFDELMRSSRPGSATHERGLTLRALRPFGVPSA